ncbi:hypothetical protein SGRIM128S_06382 [Streptomyces griseomycini]
MPGDGLGEAGGEAVARAVAELVAGLGPVGGAVRDVALAVLDERIWVVTVGWDRPRIRAAAVKDPDRYTVRKVRSRFRSGCAGGAAPASVESWGSLCLTGRSLGEAYACRAAAPLRPAMGFPMVSTNGHWIHGSPAPYRRGVEVIRASGSEHMSKILFVVTGADRLTLADGTTHPTGFWAEEAVAPHEVFRAAGHEVVVATPGGVVPPVDRGVPRARGERRPGERRPDREGAAVVHRVRAARPAGGRPPGVRGRLLTPVATDPWRTWPWTPDPVGC